MNKLLKDAIADAKAVRETALANAKIALEEAFAPKFQSMLSHKIKEEMGDDEMESEKDMEAEARMKKRAGIMSEEDDEVEIEQPHGEERSWGEKNPAGELDEAEDDEDSEDSEDEDFSDEDFDDSEDDMGDEDNTFSLDGDEYEVTPVEDDEDMDLEELLRELEGEDDGLNPNADEYRAESEDPEMHDMGEDEEHIDLNELIKSLKEGEDEYEETDEEETKEELEEAYQVIKYLRSKLSEVNLLNAKLLYVNKLFRKSELSEAQKIAIIENFDRAKNVREAKLIFATLTEAAKSKKKMVKKAPMKKKKMMEGFASAPQKTTKIISEGRDVFNRFKTLIEYNKQ